jgi:hypothetical protein
MQMSKVIVLVGLVVKATTLQAEEATGGDWRIKGKIRADSAQNTTTTKLGDTDTLTSKTSSLKLARAQFELVGKKDQTEVKIKIYGDKFLSPATVNDALKSAFLTYKIDDMFSVSAGKLDARDFSWEWDYSSTDEYLYGRAGSYGIDNVPGVELKTAFGTNALFLQVLQGSSSISTSNPSTRISADADHSTGGLTSTLQYRGSFVDGMVRPILTYANVRMASSKFTTTSGTTKTSYNYGNGYQTHLGAGIKITAAGSTTDVDYNRVKILKQKNNDLDKETNVTSISLQTRLPAMESVTPLIKICTDTDRKGKTGNLGDVSRSAFVAGAEYAFSPVVRLHAMYSSDMTTTKAYEDTAKTKIADKKVTANTINMGATAAL